MWGDRMKNRRMAAVVLMTAVLIILQIFPVWAKEEQLYALSAVLMDGETGRVLYGKEAYKGRPNASTTKVMTCILAAGNGFRRRLCTGFQKCRITATDTPGNAGRPAVLFGRSVIFADAEKP